MMDKYVALATNHKWDELFDMLEKESPQVLDDLMDEFITEHNGGEFDEKTLFTKGQADRFRWLQSSERRVEYYNNKTDDEMSANDWADLKSSALMREDADNIKKEDIKLDDFGTWITDEIKQARIDQEEKDAENKSLRAV